MTTNHFELTPEEEARALLRSTIPKLPDAVSKVMLATPAVLSALGLPVGDFVRIWDRRFSRTDLFGCLRNIANGLEAKLASADGKFHVEEFALDETSAGILRSGTEAARFPNVGLLSDNLQRRTATLDNVIAQGEMSEDREAMWRAALARGPLDEDLFLAFETEQGSSPEAAFRSVADDISAGNATFDDLIPLDLNDYAGLLGLFPPPSTLTEFTETWKEVANKLDPIRLFRFLKLSGPLSILPGGLVAQASENLPLSKRSELAQFLAAAPDPLSVVAGFEIACRWRADQELQSIADTLAPRLFDRTDPLIELAGPALASTMAITTAVTARHQTLANWPIYAKRLARFLHASHLLRLFKNTGVDPAVFESGVMRSFAPQALLADQCDARDAPIWQSRHFGPAQIHAIVLARVTSAISAIEEADRPAEWLTLGEKALASDVEAGWGLFYFSPTAFSEFDENWEGLRILDDQNVDAARLALQAGTDIESGLSELIKLSAAFEIASEHRNDFASLIVDLIRRLDGSNLIFASELALQIAARWRDQALSDRVIDFLLEQARGRGLADASAAPRFALLGAAAEEQRAQWLQRAGAIAREFAFAQNGGSPSINLQRAIDLIRDFEPELGAAMAQAKAYATLTFDRLPQTHPPKSNIDCKV